MNINHGSMMFWGLELETSKLKTSKLEYRDDCGHTHLNNVKKKEYKYCEECGEKRFYISTEYTELYYELENQILLALVDDVSTKDGNAEKKYYCVMQWYESDHKLDVPIEKDDPVLEQFKLRMKDLGIWKLKRFGLFVIHNVVPTTTFYKNEFIKRGTFAKPAIFVDPKINVEDAKDIAEKLKVKSEKKKKEDEKRKKVLVI